MSYPVSEQEHALSKREAAHDLAAIGLLVFPVHSAVHGRCSCGGACASPGKHPRVPGGLNQATIDQRQIERWWRRWPTANVAVRTGKESGIVVLDVDPAHGGIASLSKLIKEHGSLPRTLTVGTGSDGLHFYFKHPGGLIRNNAGTRLGPGLDIRGDGGYVIAPPSDHMSGRHYKWANDLLVEEMPEWMHSAIREHVYVRRTPSVEGVVDRSDAWAKTALRSEIEVVTHAPEGRRNQVLNRAAFNLGQITAAGSFPEDEVRRVLLEAGMAAGLSERECLLTISSGLRAGSALPRGPASKKAAREYPTDAEVAIQL